MARISKNKVSENKSLDRYYNIAKVLFCLSPFVCLMYLGTGATMIGDSLRTVLQGDPRFIVMFLSAMINPFVAYLLSFAHKKIKEGDISYSVVNLMVFILAEVILQNAIYTFMLIFILYKTVKVYKTSIKDCIREKWANRFLMTISGGIVVVVFALICLFATIRLYLA